MFLNGGINIIFYIPCNGEYLPLLTHSLIKVDLMEQAQHTSRSLFLGLMVEVLEGVRL